MVYELTVLSPLAPLQSLLPSRDFGYELAGERF